MLKRLLERQMKNKLYDLYLKSPEWKAISDECKRLANFKCNRCDNTTNLHAHHLQLM